MGLDISVVINLREVKVPKEIDTYSDEYYDWQREEYPFEDVWGLSQVGNYDQDRYGNYPPGTYLAENISGFRAGSYTGYGEWRNILAKVGAGFPGGSDEAWRHDGEEYPFEELINYSDADGYIAAPITDKLCNDFVSFEKEMYDIVDKAWLKIHPTIELTGEDKDWFLSKWDDWKDAMCTASGNGAVIFQ